MLFYLLISSAAVPKLLQNKVQKKEREESRKIQYLAGIEPTYKGLIEFLSYLVHLWYSNAWMSST